MCFATIGENYDQQSGSGEISTRHRPHLLSCAPVQILFGHDFCQDLHLRPPPASSSLTAEDFATFYTEKIEKICQTFTSAPTSSTSHIWLQSSTFHRDCLFLLLDQPNCHRSSSSLTCLQHLTQLNHKTLLSTLRSLGIYGTAWEWFASYLHGLSYQVTWKGLRSAPHRLSTGVPQGSVTWSSPFLPLYSHLLAKYHGFCSDLSVSGGHFILDQLKLNPSKTELLVIPGDPSPAQDLLLSLNNSMISPSATARNLGVTMDNQLSFSPMSLCDSLIKTRRGARNTERQQGGGGKEQNKAGEGSEDHGEVSGGSEEQGEASGGSKGHGGKARGSQATSTAEQKSRTASTAEQKSRATSTDEQQGRTTSIDEQQGRTTSTDEQQGRTTSTDEQQGRTTSTDAQ
ncbi:hypothetical protein QTP86_033417 [Hemibagrus guttatus]|nr:hypothetical protein QTP86_033417 [Hemibagrus guttatus]